MQRTTVIVIAALILALPVLVAASTKRAADCKPFYIEDASDDYWFDVNGRVASWECDASQLDASTGMQIQLYTSIDGTAATAQLFTWDSNGDGQRDTSILDCVTDGKRASPDGGVIIAGSVLFDTITPPDAPDVGVIRACRL